MNPLRTIQVSTSLPYPHAMSFAQHMISLRRGRTFTQQEFADATGIHVQQIKRREAATAQASAEALKKIARCFGVTANWLSLDKADFRPDKDLRLQFEAMSQLNPEEMELARAESEGLLLMHLDRKLASRSGRPPAVPNEAVK